MPPALAPTVTCIVPAYNFERFAARAVESALGQDYPADRLQVIVVDDGSTDRTAEVLAPYADRVELITKENGGLLSALNVAIPRATGEYMTLLSADDMLVPDSIRRRVRYLETHPAAGLVHGDMEVIGVDDEQLDPSFRRMTKIPHPSGRILPRLLDRNLISGGATMVRMALRDRFFPFPEHAGWEDWWIAVRIAEVAEIGQLDGPPIYRYRLHGANANLGNPDSAGLQAESLPFRRWIAACVRRDELTLEELGAAYRGLRATVDIVRVHKDEGAIRPSPASAEHAHALRVSAQRASAHGDLAAAAGYALRAFAFDPTIDLAGTLLSAAAGQPEPILDARSARIYAELETLEREPALLTAYCAAVGPGDDATLVIAGGDAPDQVGARAERALAAAVPLDAAPDVLILGGLGPDDRELVRTTAVHAALCADGGPRDLATAEDVAELVRVLAGASRPDTLVPA